MRDTLRLYFLGFYAISLFVFLIKIIPASLRVPRVERRAHGLARLLAPGLVLFDFVLPPAIVLARVGELDVRWIPLRALGFFSSLYAAVMLLWASATLGRFLVPQAVVLADHDLVTRGPYRLLRHPAYSGDLALWLGVALGTVNLLLLALWPVSALGTYCQTRQEEELLGSKFGAAYERYATQTGRLVPRFNLRSVYTRGQAASLAAVR
ncbi:MAG: isoprenylcysteine carboxylmethyltransferase family protein [Deltaproteobacteria bacterium]|nr:isoprenylcysteine carboxylmethyltransferase family protein [Deltaproteobacteria bacterium]